ncbi:MAG TPA: CBS and ACT domain-containing protein [Anaerolineaceae bacterium]|nr:CBS and ACT domain-containing protein [Anaerolineaceae bacterium]HPN50649.1 CBS and ACT domain-containing protein [Anaerolineaceae bacterium]
MLVGERMARPVITVPPDMPIQEALNLMHKEKVRRFPVVDSHGKMVGLVSEKDLLNASPSDATTLSVWEISYLLSKITVEKVMSKKLITITEDTPIEDAARLMADKKIGALPVLRDNELVGIITETSLFKILIELMGARRSGVRMEVLSDDKPGNLSKLSRAIYELGGNIISFATFMGESAGTSLLMFKVEGVEKDKLKATIEPMVRKIVDIRETHIV